MSSKPGHSILGGVAFGILGIACVTGVIRFGRDAASPRALIRMTDEGFEQRVVYRHVFVPWAEITNVSLVKRNMVKTVAVTVRNPDLMPRYWIAISKTIGSRWSARSIGAFGLLVDVGTLRWASIPGDVHSIATANLALRGSFEISTAAFPVKAQ